MRQETIRSAPIDLTNGNESCHVPDCWSVFLFPLLLPSSDKKILVAIGLSQPPLELPSLAARVEHSPLELDRLELELFSFSGLEHESMGGVKVVAKADETFDVLSVRATSLAGGFELAATEADVGVVLVGLVVL